MSAPAVMKPRAPMRILKRGVASGLFALVLAFVFVPRVSAEGTAPAGEAAPDSGEDLSPALLPGVARALHEGMRIAEIIPPKRVQWRREYVLATEKYQGQARLGPFGELVDYVAGLPFVGIDPNDPRFATKLMWNYLFGPWVSDDMAAWSFEWETGHITDGGMQVESGENRDEEQSKWLGVVGRLYTPPIHAFADNDGGIMQMEIFGPTFPAFLGLVRSGPLLTYRYLSAREDDVWYYTAWDRRSGAPDGRHMLWWRALT